MSSGREVKLDFYIHAYDVDAMGYVSNIVYVRWFEDLRHRFLDLHYPFSRMIADDRSPVILHTEVDYLLPLTIHDKPTGFARLEKAGGTKWTMYYEIRQEERLHCSGRQTGYFMNITARRPVRLPAGMVQAVQSDEG